MQKVLVALVILSIGVLVSSKHSQILGDLGSFDDSIFNSGPISGSGSSSNSLGSAAGSSNHSSGSLREFFGTLGRSSPSQIQGDIDNAGSLLSGFLTAPENQELIRNVTKRANNLLRLINLQPVRDAAIEAVDGLTVGMESLQSSLASRLYDLRSSSDPISFLKTNLKQLEEDVLRSFAIINGTALAAFEKLINNYANGPLRFSDQETLNDAEALIRYLVDEASAITQQTFAKYKIVAKVLSFQNNVISADKRKKLENQIRGEANRLFKDLANLNITNLRGFTNSAVTSIIDQVERFLDEAGSLANRALASTTPGNVINGVLLELKVDLGQRVHDFHRNTDNTLSRYVRDALNAFSIRNVKGNIFQDVLRSAREKVTARVNEIVSLVNRAIAL